MKSALPYIAVDHADVADPAGPVGEHARSSSSGRPNSLTSIAPATLNRSVIVEPMLGVELHRLPGQPLQPAPDQPGRQDEQREQHQRDQR